MIMSLIISHVIFHYFLYLSNIIILHEVHLLSNYTFPTQELILESFALPSLENTFDYDSYLTILQVKITL